MNDYSLNNLFDQLENANVTITGGSTETGPFLVEAFAQHKCNLFFSYFSHKKEAEELQQKMKNKYNCTSQISHLDLLSPSSVDSFIKQNKIFQPNILILLAGSKGFKNFQNLSWDELNTAIDGNVKANFMLAKEIGYFLKNNPSAKINSLKKIIIFSAQSAENTSHSAYGFAKAAQNKMVNFLAYKLAPEVTINTIQPIGINQNANDSYPGDDIAPLKRKVHARELAKMSLLLCTQIFDTVTGEIIRMDSGRHIMPNIIKDL